MDLRDRKHEGIIFFIVFFQPLFALTFPAKIVNPLFTGRLAPAIKFHKLRLKNAADSRVTNEKGGLEAHATKYIQISVYLLILRAF